MSSEGVSDVQNPVVRKSYSSASERSLDPATTQMPHDHDVTHFQNVYRILEACEAIQIGWRHYVGHIPVDKQLTGSQSHKLICRNPTIGAAYPEILRGLLPT
jgi:hypothetical protein